MVLSALSREDSTCFRFARQLCAVARDEGVDVDFSHPSDADLPMYDGMAPSDDPRSAAWQGRVADVQAHLWVTPEYHSGMTGAMKNLFDHLAVEPMKGDVVGLFALGTGAMAAMNTLNNMSTVARSLGAWVAPDYCALDAVDVERGLDERAWARVRSVVVEVIETARRLNFDGF